MTSKDKKLDQDLNQELKNENSCKDESHWTKVCRENPEYAGCRLYEI